MVARGEVWWSESPELGRRPVLVLSRSDVLPTLARPLVVPATSVVRGIPTEVELGESDGMPQPCVLSLDNIQPLSRALLVEPITRLDAATVQRVCDALTHATGCP